MPILSKTVIWLLAALLLSLTGMGASFWSFSQMIDASDDRVHARRVLVLTDNFLLAMKDAELGERGYVLTGNQRFLPPYRQAVADAQRDFDALRALSKIDAAQTHLAAIEPLVDAELQELEKVIALRRSGSMLAAVAQIERGEGQRLMDEIRTHVVALAMVQAEAQRANESDSSRSMRQLLAAIVAMGALALLFTLYFAKLVNRDAHHRITQAVHLETQHLLDQQQSSNLQLQTAHATLLLSEERLGVTLNSIGDAVIATDADARITLLNPVAEALTGWTHAQAQGQRIDAVFHIIAKQTREPATIPVGDALSKGTVQGLANHTVLIARDGQEYDIADSCAPIRDIEQNIVGAVLVFRDVSAEYAAQIALQDSTALLRSIFDTAIDGIVTFHAQSGAIESCNHAIEQLFGYTATELSGQRMAQLVPELGHTRQDIDLAFFGANASDQAKGVMREVTGRHKDGSAVVLEIAVSEMCLRNERYFTALLRDVSARKTAEEALRNAGALQRSIFNSELFSSIATDAQGVIQIFNVGAQRMLGYTAADVLNSVTPADLSDKQEQVERAKMLSRESGTEITSGFEALVYKATRSLEDIYELTYIRKDGGRVPALVSVTALRDDHDTIIGYLLIGSDNTARKAIETERTRLDQALRANNAELEIARTQADKANLAKSDFLSSMSHELRTPLGAILGFAQLLDSGTPPPTAIQKRSIDQVLKAGWYLLELINEILDLALIESGKIALSMESVCLSVVLSECQTMVEPQAQNAGIRMVFNHGKGSLFVNADRTRLKQVLINLLSNAIKYNRKDGTVTVECGMADPRWVRISVRDTGAGLTPEQLGQLFQPFNRLGQEQSGEEGTGIGLVVCKRLVELMGGQIGFASTIGEGSVFWFQLAWASASQAVDLAAQAPESAATQPTSLQPLHTLLYVEDNPANLMLVQDLMARRTDVRLLTASDGLSGIEMARTHLPDLILMDINLPGISGIGAMRVLASDATTAHIPVIALSANAIPRDIQKGIEAGFLRYLTKPIKIDAFTEALNLGFDMAAKAKRT